MADGPRGGRRRRPDGCRRSIAAACVLVTPLLIAIGCSAGRDTSAIVAVGLSTTTTGALSIDEATPSTRPPVTPAQIDSRLNAAIGAKDFCAFYAVIEDAVPDMSDHRGVVDAYAALAKAAAAAPGIVPSELAPDWSIVQQGIASGSVAVRAANGDVGDPSVRLVFEANEMLNAQRVIERWLAGHCPAPK